MGRAVVNMPHTDFLQDDQLLRAVLVAQLESSPDGIIILDNDGCILLFNQRYIELWNVDEAVLRTGRRSVVRQSILQDLVDPDGYSRCIDNLYANPDSVGHDLVQFRNGKVLELHSAPVRDRKGVPFGRSLIYRDITDRRRLEDDLRESEALFRSAFKHAPIGMALVSLNGHWLDVNKAVCQMFGYNRGDLLDTTFQELTHPEDLDADLENLQRLLAGESEAYRMEKRYIHHSGHVVWGLLGVSLVRDSLGKPLYFISQIEDITERKRLESFLSYRAFHDPLTGLLNRAGFEHHLNRPYLLDREVALLMIDLNQFKPVNDRLGHHLGDEVLRVVARRIEQVVREIDVVARYGGDEFVVLLHPPVNQAIGQDVAERLRITICELIQLEQHSAQVNAAIGVAVGMLHEPFEDLLQQADAAMYADKRSGSDDRLAG